MLDRGPVNTDDPGVKRSWFGSSAHSGVTAVLVFALLSFGSMCATHGGAACAGPSAVTLDEHGVPGHDTDGACGDHDGCDGDGHGDCSHASMCCSTWSPPTSGVSLPLPAAAPAMLAACLAPMAAGGELASRPVPIPAESPPPLISILRL